MLTKYFPTGTYVKLTIKYDFQYIIYTRFQPVYSTVTVSIFKGELIIDGVSPGEPQM